MIFFDRPGDKRLGFSQYQCFGIKEYPQRCFKRSQSGTMNAIGVKQMTQVVAHRGASGTRPENTLPAFAEAVRVEADVIELDVHLSKDGHLMVMHDEEVDRTTDGKGLLREKTLTELKRLNAGGWFSSEYQSTKIPTLKEVLNLLLMRNYRGVLTIEIKTDKYHYPGIEEKLSNLMTSQPWPFAHWYCSFNMKSLEIIHEIEPDAQLDFIMGTAESKPPLALSRPFIEGIHPKIDWVETHAAQMADYPIAVRPWTVDSVEGMRRCLVLGVTGIITNYPERCRQVIMEYRRGK